MIAEGAVEVNGVVVTDQKARVQAGDDIVIHLPESVESHMLPEDIPLKVLFEDDDLIVVNKPAGMVVHPAPGTPSGTLVNALLAHCGENLSGVGGMKRPGIVHRIDKDTSGLLVVAKSDAAHQGLADQFLDHSIERLYTAVCFGVPSAGDQRLMGLAGTSFEAGNQLKITTQLARHKTDRQRQAVVLQNGKHAVTRVRVMQELAGGVAAVVECKLETASPIKFGCICPMPAMLCLGIKPIAANANWLVPILNRSRPSQGRRYMRGFWVLNIQSRAGRCVSPAHCRRIYKI